MANVHILEAEVKPVHGDIEAKHRYISFNGYPLITPLEEIAGATLFNRKSDADNHLGIYQKQLLLGGKDSISPSLRNLIGKTTEDFSVEVNLSIIQISGSSLLGATISCAHRVVLRVEQFDEGKDVNVEVLSTQSAQV